MRVLIQENGKARRCPMNGIPKQAVFRRFYLSGDRRLVPLTLLIPTTVAPWLVVCVLGLVGDATEATE
jgi:hypothetical protein